MRNLMISMIFALTLFTLGCSDSSDAPVQRTAYPGGQWSPPEASYGTIVESDIPIQMSDGVVLVGDVSYPADLETGARALGSFPVILTQNPYGGNIAREFGHVFVERGYIFAGVDVRSLSRSGGTRVDLFTPRDARDGAELVSWAATLEGSSGDVGLWGCSWLGNNQIETITQLGPNSAVKAAIPNCINSDTYREILFDNGIPGPVAIAYPGVWADALPGGDRGYYRDHWRGLDRVVRTPSIFETGIPILISSGWIEGGSAGALGIYAALQNLSVGRPLFAPMVADQIVSGRYQVIVGDWGHGGGLDWGVDLQWYDTWIKGIDTGLPKDTLTPLHLQVRATGRWINAPRYPLTDNSRALYLTASGELADTPAGAGSGHITWAPPEEVSDAIEYSYEPFVDGALIAGVMAARLQISSSNTNAQFLLELYDVAPDGMRSLITHGSVLGSRRSLDPTRSWSDDNGELVRPYLTLDQDVPLVPGQSTRLDFPLRPTLWSIEPGHHLLLRLSIRPPAENCTYAVGRGRAPLGCQLTEPMQASLAGGEYSIHYGGAEASSIRLPLVEHGAFDTARSVDSPTVRDSSTLPGDW